MFFLDIQVRKLSNILRIKNTLVNLQQVLQSGVTIIELSASHMKSEIFHTMTRKIITLESKAKISIKLSSSIFELPL